VPALVARARRDGAAPGADAALSAALERASRADRAEHVAAVLGEALQAVAQERSLPAAVTAPPRTSIAGCAKLDEAAQRILHAISIGAPAYNAGDHAGCARVYRSTAEALN